MKKILAWHFTDGWELRDGQKLVEGKTYIYDGEPVMCKCGYHASRKIIEALFYGLGTVVSRVECEEITEEDYDKFVCRKRKVLWSMDVEMILHEFACRCAEHTLKRFGNGDKCSYAVIEAKRKWMRGEITDGELEAAWSAVELATWLTAWSAVELAAESAVELATWSAAWLSARSDAWSAANRLLRNMVLKAREEL